MSNKNSQKVIHNFKNFGFFYGMSFLLSKTINRKKEYKTRLKAIKLLEKKFSSIIDKFEGVSLDLSSVTNDEKNIFLFWWDGLEKAPALVKENFKLLQDLYPDYNIVLIDKSNYSKYVTLSDKINGYLKSGNISIQTFSDILRFNLLSKYGGFWMDATIRTFARDDLIENIKKTGFYSLNVNCKEKEVLWSKIIPDVKYMTFYMGATKNNPVMLFAKKMYDTYYEKYDFCIDYFMIDYFLLIAEKHHIGNSCLDSSPAREGNPFYLFNCIQDNQIPSLSECKKCPQKLNWRLDKCNNPIIYR